MSSAETLQATCVRRACDLLMRGTFDGCQVNPFSCMPIAVVQKLLSCAWAPESPLSRACIAHSRLLLTSGRLKRVVLPPIENDEDYVTLLRMLSRGCQNLRTLSEYGRDHLRSGTDVGVEQAFQELLQNATKLETLHACTYFEPNCLRDSVLLKSLSLHFGAEKSKLFYRRVSTDLLRRLESIEVFALCCRPSLESSLSRCLVCAAVRILNSYPHLTSLGYCESSAAMMAINDYQILATPRECNLRRCYWVDKGKTNHWRIRVAAASCPLVEVLVIQVHHPGCLQYLKSLRSLACLHVVFGDNKDYGPEFHSLLAAIGPQLRHLVVYARGQKPLVFSAICDNCPNLGTLQLDCAIAVNRVQSNLGLLDLKRLKMESGDMESFLFLLWNCLHLEVLCLDNCKDLDDDVMQVVLWMNRFEHLEVAIFNASSLSEFGCRRFLQSARKLERFYLVSSLVDQDELKRCVEDLNPRVVCHPPEDFPKLKREHFPLDRDTSCWL